MSTEVEVYDREVIEGEIVDNLLGLAPADMFKFMELSPSTLDEARSRSERIRAGLVLYVHTRAAIAEAWARRDWRVLGYDNWDAYLKGEFGDELRRLTGDERREAVAEYRRVGMSTRAIASAVQAPKSTVADDVRQLPESGQLPGTVKGLDGRDKPAKREEKPEAAEVGTKSSPAEPKPPTGDKPAEEKPAESPSEPPAKKPEAPKEDEGERLARQRTETVTKALASLWGQVGDDPIGWLERTWRPGTYRTHDIQAVRDVYTPAGLRRIARAIEAMASHLEENGATL